MNVNLKKIVLIVDDEPDLLDVLAQRFELKGFNVFKADGGHAALKIFKSTPEINLVVSDIRMPEGDGLELLDRIREINIDIPVVFVTGYADYVEAEIYHRGANGIFSKPTGIKAMAEHAKNLLMPAVERWAATPEKLNQSQISSKFSDLKQSKTDKYFDLGRGGFYLRTADKIPGLGEKLEFKIEFVSGDFLHITGSGIVRWIRLDPENSDFKICGIEFAYLIPEIRDQVVRWIKEQKIKPFIPLL